MKKADQTELIESINSIANQLCRSITGNFDIILKTDCNDINIRKLTMMVNFLLDSVRRNIMDYKKKQKENKKLIQALEIASQTDFLTGAYNREFFEETLIKEESIAKKRNGSFAIILIDIDDFKDVNDIYGHSIGDQLLKTLSKKIREEIRYCDYLFRLGGDEFCLLLTKIHSSRIVSYMIDSLLNIVSNKLILNGDIKPLINISLGVSIFPEHANDGIDLFNKAGLALHTSKKRGKQQLTVFNDRLYSEHVQELNMIKLLNKDFQRNFYLCIQPIYDIHQTDIPRLVGGEFLLRTLEPNTSETEELIKIAETHGIMFSLGKKIIQLAIDLSASILENKSITHLGINVSMVHLKDPLFVSFLKAQFESISYYLKYITLEFTETALMSDIDLIKDFTKAVKRMGVKVAIDDFGKEYSSLSRLSNLNIDCLKLDKSFIKKMLMDKTTMYIVESAIKLAHKINLTTVAEGIETKAQFDMVKKLGCDYAQGYYLSKPMLIDEFQSLIDKK